MPLKFHSAFQTLFQNNDHLRCIECSEEDLQYVARTSLLTASSASRLRAPFPAGSGTLSVKPVQVC